MTDDTSTAMATVGRWLGNPVSRALLQFVTTNDECGNRLSNAMTTMLADFIGGCGAGRLYCSIEPRGDIQPCVFMPITLGNIRDQKFLEIWHTAEVLKTLRDRDLLTGTCGSCPNKYICGGCRARVPYFQDLTAPDPGCINNLPAYENITGTGSPVFTGKGEYARDMDSSPVETNA